MHAQHVLALLFTLLVSAFAHAAAQRTFVSTGGDDANTVSNCSLIAPCRSFGAAISVTLAGGELIVLDSGGYGSVAITQSVTIEAPPGIYAGISVASGTGVVVNAPGAAVALRGLAITGIGGTTGIDVVAAGSFELSRARIAGMAQRAIYSHANGSSNLVSDVRVSDTAGTAAAVELVGVASANVERLHVARSGGIGLNFTDVAVVTLRESAITEATLNVATQAVRIQSLAGVTVHGSIDRVTVTGATTNCLTVFAQGAGSTIYVDVSRSAFFGCSTLNHLNAGIRSATATNGVSHVAITECVVRNSNGFGIEATGDGAIASLSRSTVVDNFNAGFQATGGGISYTLGDNTARGNDAQETIGQFSAVTTLAPL